MGSGTQSEVGRRTPQLARGELRVAVLLDAAADVIAQVGYEAATMTAIAQKAACSIGAAYQYFDDKAAIAKALCNRFGEELIKELEGFANRASGLDLHEMVSQLVKIVIDFTDKHPAHLLVMHAPEMQKDEPPFRRRLRLRLAQLFQSKAKRLDDEEAFRMASIALQVLKSLHPLSAEAGPSEQRQTRQEIATLLTVYLEHKLGRFAGKAAKG